MNIVLVQGYLTTTAPRAALSDPIGLLSVANYLDALQKGYNVSIVDLYALGYDRVRSAAGKNTFGVCEEEEIVALIRDKKPDMLGVACMFTTMKDGTYELINLLKRRFPEVPLVVGGPHATMDPTDVLTKTQADYVVRGEGEETTAELIQAVTEHKALDGIAGLTFRSNHAIATNRDRPLIRDLRMLPMLDRRFIDQDLYSSNLNRRTLWHSKGRKLAHIFTSRGCPYDCIFCSTKVVWRRRFRARTAESVVEEIEYLRSRYGIDEIAINDDQFFTDLKRTHEFLDRIIEKQLNINFNYFVGSSVWLVNDENLLRKLKQAGFYRLTFPIESGNQNTIKYIRKKIHLDRVRLLVARANRLGFWTYAYFIIGFPYETREEILQTIRFASSLGLDNATYFVAKPYAGSDMYQDMLQKELISKEDDISTLFDAINDTLVLKREEIQRLLRFARRQNVISVARNYLNPLFAIRYVLPKMVRPRDFCYAISYFGRVVRRSFA